MASPIPSNIPAKDPGNSPSSEKAADPQGHQLPPSYTPYETAQPYPSQPYPTLPHFYVSPTQQQQQQQGPRKRSVLRRFFKAFAFAVTIWALMNVLVHSILVVTRFNATFDDWPGDEDFPIPPDLERVRCSWGDQAPDQIPLKASYKQILKAPLTFPFKKEEKFELPIDSETLFFLSRGVYSGGQVKVVRSRKHSDVAKVKIRLEYLLPGGPRIAKVCQFTRGDGENGIGIFTPSEARYPRHHNLRFYVTIKLPKSASGDALHIKNFETDLPNFTQVFRKVGRTVVFDNISIKGTNGGIIGGHLVAHHGSIETSNGPVSIDLTSLGPFNITSRNGGIHGVFNATRSLTLKTHNDRIKGVIALNPDKNGSAALDLATENSLINVDVALNPFQNPAHSGGHFTITSTASRSPTRLRVREAPLNATLLANVSTSYAPAELLLPSTFEGGFAVTADHVWPTVVAGPHVRDPSGGGRKREVTLEREGSRANGSVSWSEEGKERGHVELRTSYSPAVLKL